MSHLLALFAHSRPPSRSTSCRQPVYRHLLGLFKAVMQHFRDPKCNGVGQSGQAGQRGKWGKGQVGARASWGGGGPGVEGGARARGQVGPNANMPYCRPQRRLSGLGFWAHTSNPPPKIPLLLLVEGPATLKHTNLHPKP